MTLTYKGVKGDITFNKRNKTWRGRLINVPGLNVWDGDDLKQMRDYFKMTVDGYISKNKWLDK